MQMTTDDRDGGKRSSCATIPDADWSEVESAIRRLDGKTRTEVTLAMVADGPYMAIGGGPSRYFVFIWAAEEHNLILTDPSMAEDQERLVVGGQAAIYSSRQTVPIQDALAAAKTYFGTQSPNQGLVWVEG